MQRSMAAEAEGKKVEVLFSIRISFFFSAAREARAKIIAAEGEQKASRSLKVKTEKEKFSQFNSF